MSKATVPAAIPVLMVDDDPKLCGLVSDYLEPLGYAVDAVHTGPEGVEAAREEKYRAVILDVMLPGMDGFEVLREIRRESEVPVLMLTGRGEDEALPRSRFGIDLPRGSSTQGGDGTMEGKQLNLVLLAVGLGAINLVYLADLFAGKGIIIMGSLSWTAVIIANVIAVAGLVRLCHSPGDEASED